MSSGSQWTSRSQRLKNSGRRSRRSMRGRKFGTVGGPAGTPVVELASIDFRLLAPVDPFTAIAGWENGRQSGAQTELDGSVWIAKTANGLHSIWAQEATLDLDGEAQVYCAVDDMQSPIGGVNAAPIALMVSGIYDNRFFWGSDNDSGGDIDGYILTLNADLLAVHAYRDVTFQPPYASNNFGNPLGGSGGTLSRVEMRITVNAGNNTIRVFVDDSQLGGDWEDSHVDRTPTIRTFGGSLKADAAVAASMAKLSSGTF